MRDLQLTKTNLFKNKEFLNLLLNPFAQKENIAQNKYNNLFNFY